MYRWYDPAGEFGDIPHVDDLTELPWAWYARFVRRDANGDPAVEATSDDVAQFIADHTDSRRPGALTGIRNKLVEAGGSRHDNLLEYGCWAMREAAAGRYPASEAITMLEQWWRQVMATGNTADADRLTKVTPHGLTEFGHAAGWCVAQAVGDIERVAALRAEDDNHCKSSSDAPPNVDAETGEILDTNGRLPATFWTERPELAHIAVAADSRMISREALLVVVLADIAAHIPPAIYLPGPPRLAVPNMIVGIIGNPGATKGGALDVADDVLPLPANAVRVPIGTGEGFARSFLHRNPDAADRKERPVIQHRHPVIVRCDEVSGFLAQTERSGETVTDQLKKACPERTSDSATPTPTSGRSSRRGPTAPPSSSGSPPAKRQDCSTTRPADSPNGYSWLSPTPTQR